MFTATLYVIISNVSNVQCMLAERFGFHLETVVVHGAFDMRCATFQCCFSVYTRTSQHLFVAQQAVMWAAVFGRESAIISIVYLQLSQCSGQNRLHGPKSPPPPTSALQPCAQAPLSWELWGWACVSVREGRQGAPPRVVEGHVGAGWTVVEVSFCLV